MTIGMLENGLRTADFACCEDVEMEAFSGTFKVQGMRDGNVYMQQKPRRTRNKPLLREDNSSLTLGRDGKYYFRFVLPEELGGELPETLCREAWLISRKFINGMLCEGKEDREW